MVNVREFLGNKLEYEDTNIKDTTIQKTRQFSIYLKIDIKKEIHI